MQGQRAEKGAIPSPCSFFSSFQWALSTFQVSSPSRDVCAGSARQSEGEKANSGESKGIWVFVVLFSVGLDIFKMKCWTINKNKFWAPYIASGRVELRQGSSSQQLRVQ